METDEFTEMRYEVNDGVAVVSLDRPAERNTWGGRTAVEYRWALHHADISPDVRVVVLRGEGGVFCAGADTRALDAIGRDGGRYSPESTALPPYPDGTPAGFRHNHTYPLTISVPIIAAIEGACAGAGFVLATYADLRFASETARITTAFAGLGLPAEYGIGWLLPRIMSVPNALQLLYSADVVSGTEAHRLGWVQRVTAPESLMTETLAFAVKLANESSPHALSVIKRQVFVDAVGDLDQAYRRSVEDMNAAMRHPDFREALVARRERRPPKFARPPGEPTGT